MITHMNDSFSSLLKNEVYKHIGDKLKESQKLNERAINEIKDLSN